MNIWVHNRCEYGTLPGRILRSVLEQILRAISAGRNHSVTLRSGVVQLCAFVGVASGTSVLVAIAAGIAEYEHTCVLMALAVVGALLVTIVSLLGLLVLGWNAHMQSRCHSLPDDRGTSHDCKEGISIVS